MTIETISEVRYGDLIVPSQAEMAAGKLAVESRMSPFLHLLSFFSLLNESYCRPR